MFDLNLLAGVGMVLLLSLMAAAAAAFDAWVRRRSCSVCVYDENIHIILSEMVARRLLGGDYSEPDKAAPDDALRGQRDYVLAITDWEAFYRCLSLRGAIDGDGFVDIDGLPLLADMLVKQLGSGKSGDAVPD